MAGRRLPPAASQTIDRSKILTFRYNGREVECFEGDTIASALFANGQNIFGRSFKYHRPRGLFCVSGNCPNCFMNVNGQPNVIVCTTLAKDGMVVHEQNAWPSLRHDANSIIDRFSSLLPVGFYYKSLIRPKWLWPLARRFIRNAAGYGKVNARLGRVETYEHDHRHVDLVVVGGGPAGISAAIEAGRRGLRVLIVDDQPQLGGHLRYTTSLCQGTEGFSNLRGYELASKLAADLSSLPNVEVISGGTCFGIYEGNHLGISWKKRLLKVRTKKVVVATGSFERPFAFTNNDLPGVFLGSGIQRLVNLNGVSPGRRVLVVANSHYGYRMAEELLEAGVHVVGLVAEPTVSPAPELNRLKEKGVRVVEGYSLTEARGRKRVSGAVLAKADVNGKLVSGSEIELECDAIALSIGFEPANGLLYQADCDIKFDDELGEPVPGKSGWVLSAGEVTGVHDLKLNLLQGKLAGLIASKELGSSDGISNGTASVYEVGSLSDRIAECSTRLEGLIQNYRTEVHHRLLYTTPGQREKKIVCLCEDLTESDLKLAIQEGFDDIEPLKRYSTFTMGPCQGRMCSLVCTAIHADETGLKMTEAKRTTSRPPHRALEAGLLNGPPHRPFKLTALHRKHLDLGAHMMNMGEWKRPKTYGSLETEYRAIREAVGLIDVSTLGRFMIKGADAGRFLDFVYTHVYSTLKTGKARYALLLTETGKVFDDGIIARVGDDEFFVTSSTGNAEAVEEWLRWWQVTGSLDVGITNITSGLAGINVAGPKARALLSGLLDVDLSNEASPYMSCLHAEFDGIPVILLRIGFVGETGWEIHFPAEYGEYVWEKLLEVGKKYAIRPVGVEAMRLLSLEKRHIWPTLDTDSASDALETDLGWAVKFEKPDFVGKHYLLKTQREGFRLKLVGLTSNAKGTLESGDVVVTDGKPVGRITTAGYSYTLQKQLAIAWVPADQAKHGSSVRVIHSRQLVGCKVVSGPFYDPEGNKMKS